MVSVDNLSITHTIKLQNVVRRAHQGPLRFDLFNSSHEKLPEAPGVFYLPEYRFHDRFTRSIDLRSGFGLQLPSHFLHAGRTIRQGTSFAGHFRFSMLASIGRYIRSDFLLFQICQILFRTIAAVGQNLLRFLSDLLLNDGHHRRNLLFVVGFLRHGLANDQLRYTLYRNLCIESLNEAIGSLHNARFRIAEIVLSLILWLGLLGFFLVVFFSLFPGFLLQSTLRLPNSPQPGLASAQFLRQFVGKRAMIPTF